MAKSTTGSRQIARDRGDLESDPLPQLSEAELVRQEAVISRREVHGLKTDPQQWPEGSVVPRYLRDTIKPKETGRKLDLGGEIGSQGGSSANRGMRDVSPRQKQNLRSMYR